MAHGNSQSTEIKVESISDVRTAITGNRDAWIADLKTGDSVKISTMRGHERSTIIEIRDKHFKVQSHRGKKYWVTRSRLRRGEGFAY